MKLSAIALAIPLAAVGFACRTSSSQHAAGQTASGGQAPTATSGAPASGDVRAHAGDRVVTGTVSNVNPDFLTITTSSGDQTTLVVDPRTTVLLDGREAHLRDLQEGQPVRASFHDFGGEPTAVEIRAGRGALESTGPNPAEGQPQR